MGRNACMDFCLVRSFAALFILYTHTQIHPHTHIVIHLHMHIEIGKKRYTNTSNIILTEVSY